MNIHPSNKVKYVQNKVINVPDIKDHVLRVVEVKQNIVDTKLCDGDSLVSDQDYTISDLIDHDGASPGYLIYVTKKGRKLFVKESGVSQKEFGKTMADSQRTGRIIGGTGDFSTAVGQTQFKGTFNWKKEKINVTSAILRYKIDNEDTKKAKT